VTATECLKTNENITKTLIIPSASRYYEEGEAFSGVTASSGADSGYKITKATSTHVLVIGSQQVVRTLSVEN
jgi:hypothetical protein